MENFDRGATRHGRKLTRWLGRVEVHRRVIGGDWSNLAWRSRNVLGADHSAVKARDVCELQDLRDDATRGARRVVLLACGSGVRGQTTISIISLHT